MFKLDFTSFDDSTKVLNDFIQLVQLASAEEKQNDLQKQ
jgi:hypothetical protein